MPFIVTLDQTSHQPRPNLGEFHWSMEHGRYIFRSKVLHAPAEIAAEVTEAFKAFKVIDHPFYNLQVLPVAGVASEQSPVVIPEAEGRGAQVDRLKEALAQVDRLTAEIQRGDAENQTLRETIRGLQKPDEPRKLLRPVKKISENLVEVSRETPPFVTGLRTK